MRSSISLSSCLVFVLCCIRTIGWLQPHGTAIAKTVSQITHDTSKQLSKTTAPEADQSKTTFSYDKAGRFEKMTTSDGVYSHVYHPTHGKLIEVKGPRGNDIHFTHNGMLLTKVEYKGAVQGTLNFTYDAELRLKSRDINGQHGISFQYDQDGLLTQAGGLKLSRDHQTGRITETKVGSVTDKISFNSFGELVGHTVAHSGQQLLQETLTYNKNGKITEKQITIQNNTTKRQYTYDIIGRLTKISLGTKTLSSYTYDIHGNRLEHTDENGKKITATYDAQDRLLTYGPATYTYNANGECLTKVVGTKKTTYTYDALGQLKTVVMPDGKKVEYILDATSRRVGKKVNGVFVKGWLYKDALNPIAEVNAKNVIITRFVYGSKPNIPDYMVKSGKTYKYVVDSKGSVHFLIDVDTGTIAQRIEYDAFGVILKDTNPGFQPFGYVGGIYDQDTTLTRLGARDLETSTGRWMTKDPSGLRGGFNLYQYAGSDPINYADTDGNSLFMIGLMWEFNLNFMMNLQIQRMMVGGDYRCVNFADVFLRSLFDLGMGLGFNAGIGVSFGVVGFGIQAALRRHNNSQLAINLLKTPKHPGTVKQAAKKLAREAKRRGTLPKSPQKGQRPPQANGRHTELDSAQLQLEGIEATQRKLRQGKLQGVIIDSIKKSQQSLKQQLKKSKDQK